MGSLKKFVDIKNVKINDEISADDLGSQGHTHSLYELSLRRLPTWCRLDLCVDSNIYNVKGLRKSRISRLTLMVDLANKG